MAKSAISRQNPNLVLVPNRGGTGTHMQRQNGIGTNQSGTATTHQNWIGIGTNPSGTGTNASNSPDICVLAMLSPNSYTNGTGTLIED